MSIFCKSKIKEDFQVSHIPFQRSIFVRFFEQEDRVQTSGNSPIEVVPLGGFIPGEEISGLLESTGVRGAVSKVPILFDGMDIMFLAQFPPKLWAQAFAWRFGEGLLKTKAMMDKGKEVDGKTHTIRFGDRGSEYFFEANTFGMEALVNKLEKPRNLEAFYDLEANEDHEEQYRATGAGLYGYDLSGGIKDRETGQWFARGYVPMTKETAGKVIARWRNATASGFLGMLPEDSLIKPVSFGGGKPSKIFRLDWMNRPLPLRGSAVSLPVYTEKSASKFFEKGMPDHMRMPSGMNGMVLWEYEKRRGDAPREPVKKLGRIPILQHGWLVDSKSYIEHLLLVDQIGKIVAQRGEDAMQSNEVVDLIRQINKKRAESERYSEFEYNVHQFNPKLPRLHTAQKFTLGGIDPNAQQREVIPASDDIKRKLQEHFIYTNYDEKLLQYWVIDNQGNRRPSPFVEGIKRDLLGRIQNNMTARYLLADLDMVVQEGLHYLLNQAGHPAITLNLKTMDQEGEEGDKAYDKLAKHVYHMGKNFASMANQYDWGFGTRRRRRKVISLDNTTATGEDLEKILKDYVKTHKFRGVDAAYVGQRKDIRQYDGQSFLGLLSGHDLSVIRGRIQELERQVSQEAQKTAMAVEKEREKIVSDDKVSYEKMKEALQMRDAMMARYLDLYWLRQIASGNLNVTNNNAIAWAEAQVNQEFAKRGIPVGKLPPLKGTAGTDKLSQMSVAARQGVEFDQQENPEFIKQVHKAVDRLKNNEDLYRQTQQYVANAPEESRDSETYRVFAAALQIIQSQHAAQSQTAQPQTAQPKAARGLGSMMGGSRQPKQPTQPQMPSQRPPQQPPRQ